MLSRHFTHPLNETFNYKVHGIIIHSINNDFTMKTNIIFFFYYNNIHTFT